MSRQPDPRDDSYAAKPIAAEGKRLHTNMLERAEKVLETVNVAARTVWLPYYTTFLMSCPMAGSADPGSM